MRSRTPILLDCDTGIDDAVALLYLLSQPEVEVVGITTVFGNTTAAIAARNTRKVLEIAGRTDIPIAVGADKPLVGEVGHLATHVHGTDGLGGYGDARSSEPPPGASARGAEEFISSLARAHPGELHILATAAQTNLAQAVAADPDLAGRVARVTAMGGAIEVPGNVTPFAEANIFHDPEAAQRVFSAAWPIDLVPLDATLRERLTDRHRARLAEAGSPAAAFVAAITDHYFDFYAGGSTAERSAPCHDPLAAAIALGTVVPSRSVDLHVSVDCTDGERRGATVATPGLANCRAVLRTGGDLGDLLVARLTAGTAG